MEIINNVILIRMECLKILKKFLNVKEEVVQIVDYQLRKDESAVGFAGDYYELTLNYCRVS